MSTLPKTRRIRAVRMYGDDLTIQIVEDDNTIAAQATVGWGEIIDFMRSIFAQWTRIKEEPRP